MTTLLDYTTPQSVRAILGVAETELTDIDVSTPDFTMAFEMEMSDVDGGVGAVLTQYTAINGVQVNARTADQTQFYNAVRLVAAYSIARQLLGSAPMFAPQTISDGKAQNQRVANPYERLAGGVQAGYSRFLAILKASLQRLIPTAQIVAIPTRTYFTGVAIASDPVTGV